MEWLIDNARTNVVPPWYAWGPVATAIIWLIPVGYVLLQRKLQDSQKSFYLGVYTAFWAGEGLCSAINQAITSHVLGTSTPQAFYTEIWFYVLLAVIVWPLTFFVTEMFEADAERRNRPKSIRYKPSQKGHNRVCLPTVMYITVWATFVIADYHDPVWAVAAFIGVTLFWWIGLTLIWDGRKDMPQSELEWSRFHPIVTIIALGFSAALQFA